MRNKSFSFFEAGIVFLCFGLILSLSFYQKSEIVTNDSPFALISLIIPISLYFFFIRYKFVIHSVPRSFYLGLIFGFGFFTGGLFWLIKAPLEVIGLSLIVSLLLFLLVISLFALSITPFFVALFYAFNLKKVIPKKLPQHKKQSYWQKILKKILSQGVIFCLVLPSIWTILEWFRAEVLFMPLLKIAHPQIGNFLASFASLFGVYSVSFLIWLLTGLAFLVVQNHPKKINGTITAFSILVISLFFYHQNRLQKYQDYSQFENQKFVVVQGNIKQSEKFIFSDLRNDLNRYFYLSQEFKESIIIWPETAVATFYKNAKKLIDTKISNIEKNNSIILSGVVLEESDIEPKAKLTNSKEKYYTTLTNLNNPTQNYLKTKLVIFGEYIPFLETLRPLLEKIETPFSSYSPGKYKQNPINIEKVRINSGICFEGAYGRLYGRDNNANVLVNISNDSWFDNSTLLPLLLNATRYRSIERGQFLIRSANTGISAFIDPLGRINSYLLPYQAGALSFNTPLMVSKTLYSRYGDWPILTLSLFFMGLFIIALKHNKR